MQSRFFMKPCTGLILLIAFMGTACADAIADTPSLPQMVSAATTTNAPNKNDSLTWNGITFYGIIDIGYAYQTHGAPYTVDNGFGLDYLISKASNHSISAWSNNGLSQSNIGLKGEIPISDELAGVFKLQTDFNPLSLNISSSVGSLAANNGRSLTAQTSNGDGSRAGQIFNGAGFFGIKSKSYGTLTYGRQNGLMTDNVLTYDPNAGSYAFSVIGFSGATAGMGATQNAKLNSSLKYTGKAGPLRIGAQYQLSGTQNDLIGSDGVSGSATEIDMGTDYGNFSADLTYGHKKQAIVASPLTAVQVLTNPANSLAATVSDNTAYALMVKYVAGSTKMFGGYEHIEFANPSSLLPKDSSDLGGYTLSVLTQNAYNNHKILEVYWTGVKYAVNSKLDLTAAYYGYSQNSFKGNGCSNSSFSSCSGTLDAYSLVATYKLMKHFDIYGGSMWSEVKNGLANGYLNTGTVSSMVGGRFTF